MMAPETNAAPGCAVCGQPFDHGCNIGVCSQACLEAAEADEPVCERCGTPEHEMVSLAYAPYCSAACRAPLTVRGILPHCRACDALLWPVYCDGALDDIEGATTGDEPGTWVCACGAPVTADDMLAAVAWAGEV